MKEFINSVREDIKSGKYNEGDYCINLYTTSGLNDSTRKVRCIFKNIDEFEKRASKEVEGIDPMFGILFEVWLFD